MVREFSQALAERQLTTQAAEVVGCGRSQATELEVLAAEVPAATCQFKRRMPAQTREAAAAVPVRL